MSRSRSRAALSVIALAAALAAGQAAAHPICPAKAGGAGLMFDHFQLAPGEVRIAEGEVKPHQTLATLRLEHAQLYELKTPLESPDFGFRRLPAGSLLYKVAEGSWCGEGTVGRAGRDVQGLCIVTDAQGQSYLHSIPLTGTTSSWSAPAVRYTAYPYAGTMSSRIPTPTVEPTSRKLEPPLELQLRLHGISHSKRDMSFYWMIWDGREGNSERVGTFPLDPSGSVQVDLCGANISIQALPGRRLAVVSRD